MDEKGGTVPESQEASRASRLARRLKALKRRQPEPTTPLKLLTTDELRLVLGLVERGGVLPSGEVSRPEAFRSAAPEESEALERWKQLCGEPLDHLEAAEELLDRAGEAHGWHSREAVHAALLLARLEQPDASPWFVGKWAESVLNFYAELEEHWDDPQHPHLRGAARSLARLKELGPLAADLEPAPQRSLEDELLRAASAEESPRGRQSAKEEQESRSPSGDAREPISRPWWRRVFGG